MLTESELFSGFQKCRRVWFALALCCVIGSALGVLFTVTIGEPYLLLMRRAVRCPVSIVGSIVAVAIPFLVSCILLIHSKPWLIYCIMTTHFLAFTAVGFAVMQCFGSACWLIRYLLQFPNLCLMPLLIYVALCTFSGNTGRNLMVFCTSFAIFIGMVNYFWISPFLVDLISKFETMGR